MICGKKVIVVLPSYHAALTLERTIAELPSDIADEIVLVDDSSQDATVEIARRLKLKVFVHDRNRGYGANQKTCYTEALKLGGDIILMLHPDYQYSPKLAGAMVQMIVSGEYDVVLGSRILAQNAVAAGMPRHKYFANRFLTLVQNLMIGQKLSEYHTGYRAFAREVLSLFPGSRTPTISFSTTRFFARSFAAVFVSVRSRARLDTYPTLHRSVLGKA